MNYDGEEEAVAEMADFPEIQEIHHISGARSYLVKIRVADTAALQNFLKDKVKPLAAISRTESFIVLDTAKETTALKIEDKK